MKDTFNLEMPHARLREMGKNTLFPFMGKVLLPFFALLLATAPFATVQAQSGFCGFDEALQQSLNDSPEMQKTMEENEKRLQAFIKQYTKGAEGLEKSGGNGVYTIPVVFHVIHLGEPVGTGSNVDSTLLDQVLQFLNEDFRDTVHNDTEIEFCLARRNPQGEYSTGINRVNGYGTGGYENRGIDYSSGNEFQVKGLSRWPNTDYINIWIVHDIEAGSNNIIGYATFPGGSTGRDGIVLRADKVGDPAYSGVVSHEMGHFFNLYHTFQGGNQTTCPPINDCENTGDRVCDTHPHMQPVDTCDVSGTNVCDGSSNALVAHNHMNYTSNNCRYEFTDSQTIRMRCALLDLRTPLTYSIGCAPGCDSTMANFTTDSTDYIVGTTVVFNNTSINGVSYSWLIDGVEFTTVANPTHTFTEGGIYEVCLDVTGPAPISCLNRKCMTITIYPVCVPSNDPCQKVVNGDFEQLNAGMGSGNISFDNPSEVCGWLRGNFSPFFCSWPDNNSMGLNTMTGPNGIFNSERIVASDPLDLEVNVEYEISFDYLITSPNSLPNADPPKILLGLTEDLVMNGLIPQNANLIVEFVPQTGTDVLNYNTLAADPPPCYPNGAAFKHYSGNFTYYGDDKLYLNIQIDPGFHFFPGTNFPIYTAGTHFIDNISIRSCGVDLCTPIPSFTADQDSCTVTFNGHNLGDGDDYYWNFGDGYVDTGDTVTHEFMYGDTFDVCLTISCDEGRSWTYCDTVIISPDCNQCDTLKTEVALICDGNGAGQNHYFVNVSMQVPKGYKTCEENNLHIWSEEVQMIDTSFYIDTSNTLFDEVTVAVLITPPIGYDFDSLGADGYLTFCDSTGDMVCRQFHVFGQVCDMCRSEMSSVAICNDPNPNDNIYVYEGTVTVPILNAANYPLDFVFSPEVGFAIMNAAFSGDSWIIDYSITTTDIGFSNTTALLGFYDGVSDIMICVPLSITVSEPCVESPLGCVQVWDTKQMSCTSVGTDSINFHISNMTAWGIYQYALCPVGLYGSIEGGGTVTVNYGYLVGQTLHFDINISMPSATFVSGQVYDLRLFICDQQGNVVCFRFPYRLDCQGGGGGSGGGQFGPGKPDGTFSFYSILPNPASEKLMVISNGYDPEIEREVRVLDQLGRVVGASQLLSNEESLDVTAYHTGIYFVAIFENGLTVKVEKVVILR